MEQLGRGSRALKKGKAGSNVKAVLKLQGETSHSGLSSFPEQVGSSGQLHLLKHIECFSKNEQHLLLLLERSLTTLLHHSSSIV